MEMEAGMLRQPVLHVGVLVGGVVVDHQVQIEIGGGLPIDDAEEPDELLMAMALRAAADHGAVQHVEGGKQGGGAKPLGPLSVTADKRGAELYPAHR